MADTQGHVSERRSLAGIHYETKERHFSEEFNNQ
jgi:hypothetical protein